MHTKAAIVCLVLTLGLRTASGQALTGGNDMEYGLIVARVGDYYGVGGGKKNCKDHFGNRAKLAVVQDAVMNAFIANVLAKEAGVKRLVVDGIWVEATKKFVDSPSTLLDGLPFRNFKKGFNFEQSYDDGRFCIMMEPAVTGDLWQTISCADQSDDIGHVCQVDYEIEPNTVVKGNHIFEVIRGAKDSWGHRNLADAKTACKKYGKGKPAKIHNAALNAQVLNRVSNEHFSFLIIDATYDMSTCASNVWSSSTDGDVLPYTHFSTTNFQSEDSMLCAAISPPNDGKWVWKQCSDRFRSGAGIVCERMIECECAHLCYDPWSWTDRLSMCACHDYYKLDSDGKGCTQE